MAIQVFGDRTIQSQMCSEQLDVTGQTLDVIPEAMLLRTLFTYRDNVLDLE